MTDNPDRSKLGILYVDDEPMALKYFQKAFQRDYTVFTAECAGDGLDILEAHAETIGMVVSDQRMPKVTGVEFLAAVRRDYPEKIRILTTAYSDLDSAIQAVNQGHIYQYVVKPWELEDFRMVLKRAADFFHVLRERNCLYAVKMSTLQRIILADRVKTLSLMAHAAGGVLFQGVQRALYGLLKGMPDAVSMGEGHSPASFASFGLHQLLAAERVFHQGMLEQLRGGQGGDAAGAEAGMEGLREADGFAALAEPALLRRALALFKAAVDGEIPGADANLKVLLEEGPPQCLRLAIHGGETAPGTIGSRLFGLLGDKDPGTFGSRFFVLLTAAAMNGIGVDVAIRGGVGEPVCQYAFPVDREVKPEILEEAILERYHRQDIAAKI